ncbi:MAG: phenylalanine--tRNA ligase subunit beta [Ferruginibacter sp.]
MIISYNWLLDYLPPDLDAAIIAPENISKILTAIGLEVESLEKTGEVRGGLKGLIAAEVLTCEKHPDADKLKVTTVSTGSSTIQIVCGANNITAGLKVIVAPVNTAIYPTTGGTITIKKTRIRGVESEGMICSEDEIGLGHDHNGIKILPTKTVAGTLLTEIIPQNHDHIFEIGLTPNRIDAMSHIGVAKDICAYLSNFYKKEFKVIYPFKKSRFIENETGDISVTIKNEAGCKRYSGLVIKGITVMASPEWLTRILTSIGVKPINNIVDITNFVLHETGQPLHAFDADKIISKTINVQNADADSTFISLDEKERKLSSSDLMICDGNLPVCMAGVYGGLNSGVSETTKNIFLESAWFLPSQIRMTSLNHNLRTDAAIRFEKGTDIDNTVKVLERAAMLIMQISVGSVAGKVIDIYPTPVQKTKVGLHYDYLEKLSGKKYEKESIKNILLNLGFEIIMDGPDDIIVNVPHSKPDVVLPADIVEEIMRIDGLDNIDIPQTLSLSPAIETNADKILFKEKIASFLSAAGYFEIFTNSVSNSRLYDDNNDKTVTMLNNLSSELDIMRPSMLQSGLQAISHNLNRKNNNLRFYEFGKTYLKLEDNFKETQHLCIYVSGNLNQPDWKNKEIKTDIYHLKGIVERLFTLAGYKLEFKRAENSDLKNNLDIIVSDNVIGFMGEVSDKELKKQDIRQPVYFADINWERLIQQKNYEHSYKEISRFPAAQRDLAIVIDKEIPFDTIKKITEKENIPQLTSVELFDIFQSEKLGVGKKSVAINYIFTDDTRTLTDKDIESMMNKLIRSYQKELNAEIRN